MKTPLTITILISTLLFSCDNSTKKTQDRKRVSHVDTLQLDSSKSRNPIEETLKNIPENIKPVLGYRFILSGDFDGDGKKEKLTAQEIYGFDKVLTEVIENFIDDYEYIVNEQNYNKYKGE